MEQEGIDSTDLLSLFLLNRVDCEGIDILTLLKWADIRKSARVNVSFLAGSVLQEVQNVTPNGPGSGPTGADLNQSIRLEAGHEARAGRHRFSCR